MGQMWRLVSFLFFVFVQLFREQPRVAPTQAQSAAAPPVMDEPLVDFDLEVQVDVKKGQFVLHPNERTADDPRT